MYRTGAISKIPLRLNGLSVKEVPDELVEGGAVGVGGDWLGGIMGALSNTTLLRRKIRRRNIFSVKPRFPEGFNAKELLKTLEVP